MPRGVARDHDEKRAGLRAGAATYFARHGFDRASMSGAARECGVSKALIYHYYDSKEALLYDILGDTDIGRALRRTPYTGEPLSKVVGRDHFACKIETDEQAAKAVFVDELSCVG